MLLAKIVLNNHVIIHVCIQSSKITDDERDRRALSGNQIVQGHVIAPLLSQEENYWCLSEVRPRLPRLRFNGGLL